MKKFLALLPTLCLMLALAACGGGKTVVGTWDAKAKVAEIAGDELGDMKELFENVSLELSLEMREDNSFTLTMDGRKALPDVKEALHGYLPRLIQDRYGMPMEEFEKLSGMTTDEIIEAMVEDIDFSKLTRTVSGSYTEKDGELTLTDEKGEQKTGSWKDDALSLRGEFDAVFAFTRGGSVPRQK